MTRKRRVRIGAVVAVAVVAGFLVWLLVIRDSGSDNSKFKNGDPTEIAESEAGVASLATAAGHTVYWVGTQPDTKLEATLVSSGNAKGNAYVRYLTPGAAIGDPNPDFLTVGTYPVSNAYGALKNASRQPGAVVKSTRDKGLAVTNTSSPTSVYIAYRDQDLQVEVYDPNPKQALRFATSGAVTPID